jgi:hypothetical protein
MPPRMTDNCGARMAEDIAEHGSATIIIPTYRRPGPLIECVRSWRASRNALKSSL